MSVLFKNADITLYNRYLDKDTGFYKYQRTVIKGVNWQNKRNGTITDKGLLLSNSTLIFINKLDNYIDPKNFVKLSPGERSKYFTFAAGDKIVKGEISFNVTGVSPYTLKELETTYPNVIDIKSINELNTHFEIEGV